jgi:Peptidase family C25
MVGSRTLRTLLVLAAVLGVVALPACDPAPPADDPDADLVLVLPALGQGAFERQRAELLPFLEAQGLTYSLLPLSKIVDRADLPTLTADQVRDYLRDHYTWRVSTEDHPRYLGIIAPPTATYNDATDPQGRVVPRFEVAVGGLEPFGSDVPYGILPPATIDGGDGTVEPTDLDVTRPTFEVFRVPVTGASGIRRFVERHDRFMASEHRSDLTLVSGEFGLFPGDSSVVQCINATSLAPLVTRILTVFDSTASACPPDVLTSATGPRLANVLADPAGAFAGGTIVDVSHGSARTISAGSGLGEVDETFANLHVADVPAIPTDRLNVYISIACDNDGPPATGINLASAMYRQASVTVVSATTTVYPVSLDDILFAEVESIAGLYQNDQTLLQRMHAFRAEYYERFVLPAAGGTRDLLWTNVLTVGVTGDGLVRVASSAST